MRPGLEFPLEGKKIVITRAEEQAGNSLSAWSGTGANIILLPVIEITEPEDWSEFDRLVSGQIFDLIVFTSANAVKMFARRTAKLGIELNYAKTKTAAVGKKTAAACSEWGIPVSVVPEEFSAKGIIQKLKEMNLRGMRIFIPRSALAKNDLVEGLAEAGALVSAADAYNVTMPKSEKIQNTLNLLSSEPADMVIFTSPSTYRNFIKLAGIDDEKEYFRRVKAAAIGSVTKTEIEKRGVTVSVVPAEYTMEGMRGAVIEYFAAEKAG